jgi:hypothetical protein
MTQLVRHDHVQVGRSLVVQLRRVLGDDHPNTLTSASNLAISLVKLGEHQAARELDEDTLTRYRRLLGDDHPDTLIAASNLANRLAKLGDYQAARELQSSRLDIHAVALVFPRVVRAVGGDAVDGPRWRP